LSDIKNQLLKLKQIYLDQSVKAWSWRKLDFCSVVVEEWRTRVFAFL